MFFTKRWAKYTEYNPTNSQTHFLSIREGMCTKSPIATQKRAPNPTQKLPSLRGIWTGTPNNGTPESGKRDPYYSHIFRDSYGNNMGPAYHFRGSHCFLGVPSVHIPSKTPFRRPIAQHERRMVQQLCNTNLFFQKIQARVFVTASGKARSMESRWKFAESILTGF